MNGKIIKGIAGFYYVETDEGHEVYQCRAKGTFRRAQMKPLAGDNVDIEITHEKDREGNITRILPRKNGLIRPPVANIDQMLLTFAFEKPSISHYLINRFLVLLNTKSLPAILCFNKSDLSGKEDRQALLAAYEKAGCGIVFVSAKTGEGIKELKALLAHRVSAVAGPSGVGKSSLINALIGEERMQTGALSKKIGRGKNTTRHTELFSLPAEDAYICDTPGFMSLDVKDIEPKNLRAFYPEFVPYEAQCRYATCTHLTEPDCAVKEALSKEEIAAVRYDAYKLLYDELSGNRPVYVKKAKKEG